MKSLSCNHPDRDVPGIKCGYPLPCPWHTVVIDVAEEPYSVKIPLANKEALNQAEMLIDIGNAMIVPTKRRRK